MTIIRASGQGVRPAYTLVEVLVAIGIISILAALGVPAVQAAREAARRAKCMNNLRQIGISVNSYLSNNSVFPPNKSSAPIPGTKSRYHGNYSVFTRLLPYLEKNDLYNSINFEVGAIPLEMVGIESPHPRGRELAKHNSTAFNTSINTLICPSDSGEFTTSGCSYRGNTGVGPFFKSNALHPDGGNGLFPDLGMVLMSSVPDGLSHTAAFSERITGMNNSNKPSPTNDIFVVKSGLGMETANDAIEACRASAFIGASVFKDSGRWWFYSGRERTIYNHAQVPNGSVPDCLLPSFVTAYGNATARSQHPGGVNTLAGDGSVRFITDDVNLQYWRGFGTRNGRELVD